jgi:hypothetical protein
VKAVPVRRGGFFYALILRMIPSVARRADGMTKKAVTAAIGQAMK